jgi:hypothetical protein
VIVGIIVLVIGIALIGTGVFGVLKSTTIITTFAQSHTGEYVSTKMNLNTSSLVVVTSPATAGGIVPAQDMGAVNSTDISTYAVPYNSTAAGTETYTSLNGDYYYVAFSSAQPNTKIVATGASLSAAAGYGLLAIAGLVCIVVGIAVAIVGVLLKNHRREEQALPSDAKVVA